MGQAQGEGTACAKGLGSEVSGLLREEDQTHVCLP